MNAAHTIRFYYLQACFHFKLNLSALAIAVRLLDRFLNVCMIPVRASLCIVLFLVDLSHQSSV